MPREVKHRPFVPRPRDWDYLRRRTEHPDWSDAEVARQMGVDEEWARNRRRSRPGFAEWVQAETKSFFMRSMPRVDAHVLKMASKSTKPGWARTYYQRAGVKEFLPGGVAAEGPTVNVMIAEIRREVAVMSSEDMKEILARAKPQLVADVLAVMRGQPRPPLAIDTVGVVKEGAGEPSSGGQLPTGN